MERFLLLIFHGFAFLIGFLFLHCIGPAAYREIPADFLGGRSFVRFRLPDLGQISHSEAPGEYTSLQDRRTYFFAIYLSNPALLEQHRSLNPPESYWKKFYQNFSSLPNSIVSEPRFNILPNCEYFVPAPSGIHRFEVFTYNRNHAPVGGGRISKMIDLPAEHSLRIHLRNPKDLPESAIDSSKYISYTPGDQILFSLEPTPLRMEPQICESKVN